MEFSRQSRKRMLRAVLSIDTRGMVPGQVWFATLTYPGKEDLVPRDPRIWKRDLEVLKRRFEREYGRLGTYWKLEFQRRGAAHYHLLVVSDDASFAALARFRLWLSRAWWEVVGSGDADHLKAGTNVKPAKTFRGVASYAAKYLGKEAQCPVDGQTGELVSPGRFWGVWHRAALPVRWVRFSVPWASVWAVRRVLRRACKRRASCVRCGLSGFMDWMTARRVLHWAGAVPEAIG